MEQRALGKSGLKASAIGLGCNNFGVVLDAAATKAVVGKAIDLGISLFDTANTYGNNGMSEEYLGKALGARRKDILVATKFGMPMGSTPRLQGGGSRDTIMREVEGSLKRLGTDYIDLYQIHMPDPMTPIAETLRAMDDLIRQGKVRYIGHSNFSGWQAADAAWAAQVYNCTPFVSAQNRYSILTRTIEADLVPACQAHGVSIIPYFPLESGLLSGKYKSGGQSPSDARFATWAEKGMPIGKMFEPKMKLTELLHAWCTSRDYNMLDVAFGWLLAKPYVGSVIAGATKPQQLEANVLAAAWRPTPDDLAQIDGLSPPPNTSPF